jgi:hypothetical protein
MTDEKIIFGGKLRNYGPHPTLFVLVTIKIGINSSLKLQNMDFLIILSTN